jgi:hypothetical protein
MREVTREEMAICLSKSPFLATLTKNELSFSLKRSEMRNLKLKQYFFSFYTLLIIPFSQQK